MDLDAEGRLIGVEMLGPGSLQVVFQKVIPKYHAAGLKQLENRRRIIEEVLSGAV